MGFCFFKFLILHSYGLPVQTIVEALLLFTVTHFHPYAVDLGFPSPPKIPDIWRSPGAVNRLCHSRHGTRPENSIYV